LPLPFFPAPVAFAAVGLVAAAAAALFTTAKVC